MVNVTVLALLVVLTTWLPKSIVPLGENVTGCTPRPDKFAVCGLLLASSEIARVPESNPSAVGVKVTLITQLEWAPTGDGHPLAAKSPDVVMLVMFRGTDWLL